MQEELTFVQSWINLIKLTIDYFYKNVQIGNHVWLKT